MLISLNWLNELIDLKAVNFEYLLETLTLGGFEVENSYELIINKKKDTILDISTTPNRSDTLSFKGIAKEISSLTNKFSTISKYGNEICEIERLIIDSILKIPNLDKGKKNYSIFCAVIVENLTSFYSPNWLKQKLFRIGIQPSNNLLDLKHYIQLETGYPFELYDLNKIRLALNTSNFKLSLNCEKLLEPFEGSNNFHCPGNSNVLVLKAHQEILSLAGILVNKKFEYDNTTQSLLIEASIFNAKQIRQISRTIGVRTDRSSMYEKGLNSTYLIESLCRFLYLLKSLDNKIHINIHTAASFNKVKPTVICLKYKTVTQILGPIINNKINKFDKLSPLDISNYLTRLNFLFTFDNSNLIWQVTISLQRYDDIKREIDLIEEIARLHGFNNFSTILPDLFQVGKEDFSYQIRKKITSHFLNEGFNEIITYSLANLSNNTEISIINSLSKDYSVLRSTLLQNLIQIWQENLNHGTSGLEAFEYGHVFFHSKFFNPIESEQVAGIFGSVNIKTEWSSHSTTLSWFEAKGKLEQLFNKLNLSVYWKSGLPKLYKAILHPYRTCKLCLAPGIALGIFGQINPILANKLTISPKLYLFEFNLEIIKNDYKYKKLLHYNIYNLYPKVFKDLSFIISKKISFTKIKNLIFLISPKVLISIDLLDEYKGNSIPKQMTSLCIQLTFQSNEKTLLTIEVEKIIQNIKIVLTQEFKSIFRS
jgi:phenylalanyl-tRNA synthetase beta chain